MSAPWVEAWSLEMDELFQYRLSVPNNFPLEFLSLFFFCLPNWLGWGFLNNISLKSLVYQIFLMSFFFPTIYVIISLSSFILLNFGVIMRVFSGDETASFVFHVHENILIKFGINQFTAWLFPVWSVNQFTACKLL